MTKNIAIRSSRTEQRDLKDLGPKREQKGSKKTKN